MKKSSVFGASLAALAFSFLIAVPALAADQTVTDQKPADIFANLKFRNLGPAVAGGRVAAVAGIPGQPNIYYAGAGGGGVWKTVDGGLSWKAIFEHASTSSIGAIAIAPSNPNLIWVGTGEGNVRNDVVDGNGVYFSSDAGHSWKFMGLAETQQISTIVIDPHNPNLVFVGAMGHAWGPNPDRGVYRTTDGGKTWAKVLFVNDSTGVSDLAMAPGNSKVLFAGMWEFRRYPWTLMDGGPGSGIYRSTDGGDTWQKLAKGLPEGPLGRVAVAVAPTNPEHIYALIGAKRGMLWQSLDMGDSWTAVSDNHGLDVRAFYFSRFVVSPNDENKLYFLSFNLMESDDGGKTAHSADRGVHSDHHAIWIDPTNPDRMIQGNDGGVYLSTDGAKSWQFLDRLPIEQFYMVAADSRQPYFLCGGLQDNSAWCGPSSDLSRGRVAGAGWYTVVGGDGEYSVPAPSDPDIVYSDSQNGSIVRLDLKNHTQRFIRPYLDGVEEVKPADLKYRFNWTSPIAVSPTDANEVYLGANVLFKTTDGGKTWAPISGDLTRNDKTKQEISGGPVQHDISGAETYGTIMSITLAPSDAKVIWVGTDDGLVQVTRDGGKSWANVTSHISGAPEWARVYQVGVSPFNAGSAYVVYDAHELDNRHPYAYRTSDFGATWQSISAGLPNDSPVHVVREDPNHNGLLVAGTDTGLFFSHDNGDHWQPLTADFPTAPVYDVQFVKNSHDLLVATHGCGLFVFDDIRPLEELTPEIEASAFHLFTPAPGVIYHPQRGGGGERGGYSAPNAPNGVVIDYFLKSEIKSPREGRMQRGGGQGAAGGPGVGNEGPVKMTITDEHGDTIATESGPANAGINRYVWNMRYAGATRYRGERPPAGGGGGFGFNRNAGPQAIPGSYKVSVTVNGDTQSQSFSILPDPNLKADPAILRANLELGLRARSEESALSDMMNRIDDINKQLSDFQSAIQSSDDKAEKSKYESILSKGRDLSKKLMAIKDAVYNSNIQHDVAEDDIHDLTRLYDEMQGIGFEAGGGYGEPVSPIAKEKMDQLFGEVAQQLKAFNEVLKSDVPFYNNAASAAGAPTVFGGAPIEVKAAK